jgi:hypothetical protein
MQMNPNKKAALASIKANQHSWARAHGVPVDGKGYTLDLAGNLFKLPSSNTLAEFSMGSGSELRLDGPGKIQALHSSSALACNVFDFWRERDFSELSSALGTSTAITHLEFEGQCRTPLRGTPPNLDVVLYLTDGSVIGVESKFTEPYSSKSGRAPFASSYFANERSYWTTSGLPRCQELAGALNASSVTFEYLDVAQLLKHALGLRTKHGHKARLWYLWYDVAGQAGQHHGREVEAFTAAVDAEIGFRAMTYQALIARLAGRSSDVVAYREYLGTRYGATAHGV